MKETVWLGPAPFEEDCAQIGDPDYRNRAIPEVRAYIEAIKNKCGEPPEGATLRVKSQQHDHGTYYEAIVEFDPEIEAAERYAMTCENDAPATWDEVGMTAPVIARARTRP